MIRLFNCWYDSSKFVNPQTLTHPEKDTIKEIIDKSISKKSIIPIIPPDYTFVFGSHTEMFIDILKYDESICLENKLSNDMIGSKINSLQYHSAKCVKKQIIDPFSETFTSELLELNRNGDIIFGYIYDINNMFINVSHLCKKYKIDFVGWKIKNSELVEKYSKAIFLKESEIIIKHDNSDTYIIPGLCIHFMSDTSSIHGELLKYMINSINCLIGKNSIPR